MLAGRSIKGLSLSLATNLTGGFLVSREVYGQFMKLNGGAIVSMLANVWMHAGDGSLRRGAWGDESHANPCARMGATVPRQRGGGAGLRRLVWTRYL